MASEPKNRRSSDEGDSDGSSSRADRPSPEHGPNTQTSDQRLRGEALESRSFWKAGNHDVVVPVKASSAQGELIEHARVHPKFLHSNATSHKWAFGAIAELLDNAVDEIRNGATFVKVDRIDIMKDNSPALLFHDDGGGMDPDGMRKCMSLGYSSKKDQICYFLKKKKALGGSGDITTNYSNFKDGNGFKTSTMRLGADVIVFSRAKRTNQTTQSIGLLSYTYLRKTGQEDVIVPMIDFDTSNNWAEPIVYGSQDDWSSNLKTILEWSPFKSKEELLLQFNDIGGHGTKVIIYNLWLNDEGIYELSFDDDDEDIRLREEAKEASSGNLSKKTVELRSHITYRIRYSLRAYASILYLKKFQNFSIILRGKPVEQFNIADELQHSKIVTYKPGVATIKEITVETKIGFVKEAPNLKVSGFNVYHKNRLIRPFWKVSADGSSKGSGVIGVLEANFIEPAHDKQDFERSALYIRLETRLKQMVHDYWKTHCHLVGYQAPKVSQYKAQIAAKNKKLCSIAPRISNDDSPRNRVHGNLPASSYELVNLEDSDDEIDPRSADEICQENIQLFARCDEHLRKQAELKQTISDLEAQLSSTKQKWARLNAYLANKKKLNAS